MAKGRMIMRTIATGEKLNSLKVDDQWFFMRMLPFMDDYGRMTGNLFELKFQVIPSSSWDVKRVENSLIRIVNAELIYWLKNDTIQFRGFHKNQKIGHDEGIIISAYYTPRDEEKFKNCILHTTMQISLFRIAMGKQNIHF